MSSPDDDRLRLWSPVGQAVALLLGPYAEVVLHDAATDRVLAIWNPISGRVPGDPSLLGELDTIEPAGTDVYGPYEKSLADGRRLSCVSAVLRDPDGRSSAVLCVNLDRTPFEHAAAVLQSFAAPTAPPPPALFEQDWTENMRRIIGGFVRTSGRQLEKLSRPQRIAVLAELDSAGILDIRRSAPTVAAALKISRATLYSLLTELKTTRSQP
ncbi:hypothetical protein D1871_01040 [Nakamurella silvestris]|nr:hypothetical protein D1871_01040 [Nakamurella silvestris]